MTAGLPYVVPMTATLRFKNIVKKLTPPSRTRSLANNLTDNDSRLWVLLISKKNFLRANGWHLGRYFTPTKVTKHRKLKCSFFQNYFMNKISILLTVCSLMILVLGSHLSFFSRWHHFCDKFRDVFITFQWSSKHSQTTKW